METLDIDLLIGKMKEEAINTIRSFGLEDGRSCIGTCDFRTDRVNLSVVNGKITKASIG